MDDKLRKQIEGIGFVYSLGTFDLNIKNRGFMLCDQGDWIQIWSGTINVDDGGELLQRIDNPTFEQILDAILYHAKVDLKPKLTKRQEINELKEAVAELHQIAIQNKAAIDKLNMSAPLDCNPPVENKLEFEVGEWVESTVAKDGTPAGTKLLVFISKNSRGNYRCSTGEEWDFYNDTELKHLNKEV